MFTVFLFSQVIYRPGTIINSFGFCRSAASCLAAFGRVFSVVSADFCKVAAIVCIAIPLVEMLRNIGNWMPSGGSRFRLLRPNG